VDVGAKLELGKIIQKITREGASVVLISSEIEEIVDLSDRVLVMRKGKLVSVAAGDDINNTKLMWLAMGEK
jgi:ribose transport system ATP-binding protein